jgi:hypothetical protein
MKNRFKILFLFFSLFQANALVAQYQLIKVNGNIIVTTPKPLLFLQVIIAAMLIFRFQEALFYMKMTSNSG